MKIDTQSFSTFLSPKTYVFSLLIYNCLLSGKVLTHSSPDNTNMTHFKQDMLVKSFHML